MNELDQTWAEKNLSQYCGFDDFVRRGLGRAEVLSWVHFRPQSEFILSKDGAAMVDFVGRYERLHDDFAVVARRLGIDATLGAENRSEHLPFATYYTLETANVVARAYARDVAAFGYASPV
jgi:hypothetical protein